MNEQLMQQIDAFLQANRKAIVQDMAAVVAVRSVEESPAPGAPFGPGPRKALDTALAVAGRLGLATNDGDGYLGWAEVPGKEAGYLAAITHVDIVPEGDGWDGDPLVLRKRDGWLLGRGIGDDKGPGILTLYAAKFLQDEWDGPLRYGFRALLGCNEETGMGDVPYYLARNPQPLFCFSPDAEFPVCNGEKGIYSATLSFKGLGQSLVEFAGGIATNAVAQKAHCVVRTQKPLTLCEGVTAAPAGDGLVRLNAVGVGGHAASPEGTVNAIGLLVNTLLQNGVCEGAEEAALQLLQQLHSATDGSGLGIASADAKGVFTPLTCVGGTICFENGQLDQTINIRYPTSTTGEAITAALTALAERHGGTLTVEADAKPFYIEADNPAIKALLDACREVSGQDAAPFTIGGGTYARHFQNAVSYGPRMPGEVLPPFAGPEHGANEGMPLDGMLQALKIYILALIRLQEIDF